MTADKKEIYSANFGKYPISKKITKPTMKKINQIMHLLLLTIALFSSALLADQSPAAASQDIQLGVKNEYLIGDSSNPVRATEYCDYLNAMAPNDRPWIESHYYDRSFMNTSQNWTWQNISYAAIYRTGSSGNYQYSVIPGHENDIIVAVDLSSIQQEFTNWRDDRAAATAAAAAAAAAANAAECDKNPTRQELCDYINAKIAGKLVPSYLDIAVEIQNRYPLAAEFQRSQVVAHKQSQTISLWQQVDNVVNAVYGTDTTNSKLHVDENGIAYTTAIHNSASDASLNNYVNRWGLVVSEEQDGSLLFPTSIMPKHFVLRPQMNGDEREVWGSQPTSQSTKKNGLKMCEVKIDSHVVTKIPFTPPTPPTPAAPASDDSTVTPPDDSTTADDGSTTSDDSGTADDSTADTQG